MKINTDKILNKILELQKKPLTYDEGQIMSVRDGIVQVSGLPEAMYGEVVLFPGDLKGLVFNLEKKRVGIIVLGDYQDLREGDFVSSTKQVLSVPGGEAYLGRVIDPLGTPHDDLGEEIKPAKMMPLEKVAPGVVLRQPVNKPLQTGIKAIDAMVPIGRGQRELIIGDRGTGKTQITLDTIINQKDQDVICIYVAIGQKGVRIARIKETLAKAGALKNTIIVSTIASNPASLQYIAPFAGVAMGEYFLGQGKDVLIIYDDLTKHAWAYRQLALLLQRPTGREAFPGDIFYLHSRLLERACCLNAKSGGGSITALPIIETQAGDLSGYIPTNVISITDGQIYLESDLFFAGIRPAINVGLSVSRVGGAAQIKAMKQVAGKLRLDFAQYQELVTFTQFSTDLDPATKKKIDRGSRIAEIFKQPAFAPLPVAQQVCLVWSVTQGFLDDLPINQISAFETDFLSFLKIKASKMLAEIEKTGQLSQLVNKQLPNLTKTFKEQFINNKKINLIVNQPEEGNEKEVNVRKTKTNQKKA